MSEIKFDEQIKIDVKIDGSGGKKDVTVDGKTDGSWSAQIKDKDWSAKVTNKDASLKVGDNTIKISKPSSGSFNFPGISISHANKEIVLPGKAGKINSSSEISYPPLTCTFEASLTRKDEVKVGSDSPPSLTNVTSMKVPEWIATDPMFDYAGTLNDILWGSMFGFRFAKKVTLNFGEISSSSVKSATGDTITYKCVQTAKIEIRPYVSLDDMTTKIKDISDGLDKAKKAQDEIKRQIKIRDEKKASREKTMTALKIAGGVLAALTLTLSGLWWTGIAEAVEGPLIVEKTIEIGTLTALAATYLTAIATAETAITVAVTSITALVVVYHLNGITTNDPIAASNTAVEQFEKKKGDMEKAKRTLESDTAKVRAMKEGTTLLLK